MTEPSRRFRAACIQTCSGREPDATIAAVGELIRAAAARGARFVMTPEQTALIETDRERLFARVETEDRCRSLARLRELADELDIWLLVGSLGIRTAGERLANRSFLIAPDGAVVARYDKIHMFDVSLANGETFRESANYAPGSQGVVAALPWGRLGMTVCYDLRFPHLYRALAQAGAKFLSVPSAFTRQTGEAHWHVLLRARAIETGSYVFAPAQGGRHETGRETYGHSLIVDPWGELIAEAGTEPGVIVADIDPARVAEARRRIPALEHDRPFRVVMADGREPALKVVP